MNPEHQLAICTPRHLPHASRVEAANRARSIRDDNVPAHVPISTPPPRSSRLTLEIKKYWGKSGVKLTVGFLDDPEAELRRRLLLHMNAWARSSNVQFTESSVDPQVRISRVVGGPDGGYWSYVGTDILSIASDKPTMNLEGFTMDTRDEEFHRVVRHETGHTLGFPHEHMRAELVKRLDRQKVIEEFMRTQDWSEQEVIDQILTPLDAKSIIGTPPDVDSIMCYQIPGRLTVDGRDIPGGLDIDRSDYQFAAKVYPRL